MRREAPEPWATAMIEAGATDPRNARRPSMKRLGELAGGIGTSTIAEMMHGGRRTDVETIHKVADALRVKPETVSEWIGWARAVRRPYRPPDEADLLTDPQRKALNLLIRSIVADRLEERDGDDRDAPATTPPGGAPGQPTTARAVAPGPDTGATSPSAGARRQAGRP